MQYDKKKDSSPKSTVDKIKSILETAGIYNLEQINMPRLINDHVTESVFLRFSNDMTITSNGKGINLDYATASAYGEFIERLQNGSLFNTIAPDSKFLSPSEISEKEILKYWFNQDLNIVEKYLNSAIDISSNYLNLIDSTAQNAQMLPFYHVNNDKVEYIPSHMLQFTGGFTGSCAGNSPCEALVEGLSEVFERHVIRKAIKESISFPDIPESIYLQYEPIKKIVEYCHKLGFRVVVKDASLGKKYPVTCVVLFDDKRQGYYAWFGAHPCLPISIERCFTEIFQGFDFSDEVFVNTFFKQKGQKDNPIPYAKCDNAFNNRFLEVNPDFFTKKPDYEFDLVEWSKSNSKSNSELLIGMINILLEEKKDIFIRNISFLGFPSFIISVPALMSTFIDIEETSGLDLRLDYYKTVKTLGENLPISLSAEEIIGFFTYSFHLQMMLRNEYKNLEMLYIIALIQTKQYKKALSTINALKQTKKYYKYKKMFALLSDFIVLSSQGVDFEQIKSNVLDKYGKYFSTKILAIFAQEDSLNNAVNVLKKGKLYSLKHTTEDAINLKNIINKNLEKIYSDNIPNQMMIKELLYDT